MTVTLKFGDRIEQLVLKRQHRCVYSRSAAEEISVHRRVCASSEFLKQRLPRYFGFDPETDYIAMEHISGPTLLEVMKNELRRGVQPPHRVDDLLAKSAALLAAFHRIEPAALGIQAVQRSYRSFADGLRDVLEDLACLPYSTKDQVRQLIAEFPADFLDRDDCFLNVSDTQPKNLIIKDDGTVTHIDLQYNFGPPPLGAATFMTALFRLEFRLFRSYQLAKIAEWHRLFVRHYLLVDPHTNLREIRFFYLLTLLHALREQLKRHRILRPWLVSRYVSHLNRILDDEFLRANAAPLPIHS